MHKKGSLVWAAWAGWAWASTAFSADGLLVRLVSAMEKVEGIEFSKGTPQVVKEGPHGEAVLRFEGRGVGGVTGRIDAEFAGRIDLKALGIEPRDYDLLKVEVKSARAAGLRFSLENYPEEGDLSHWYVLDGLRGPVGWTTIWIDLKLPEEIKKVGEFKGMEQKSPAAVGLRFDGSIKDTGRVIQGEDRRIWLGKIRFCKKAVDLDWDQSRAPYSWEKGQDLIFSYSLTVMNKLDRNVTAKLRLLPVQVRYATAKLSEERVELGAKQTRTIQAEVKLAADIAAKAEVLYSESFEARAEAEGIEDSEVTILRSSDPIYLTVTVPIPEEKLQHPLLPLPKTLPQHIVRFSEEVALKEIADDPDKVIEEAKDKGLTFTKAVISAAYLYHFTGERKYLELAAKYFAALPDIWKRRYEEWRKDSVRLVSHGIVVGNTLQLGWRVGGTQRSPYQYGVGGNEKGGGMSSIAYAYDMLAVELASELRRKVIEGFFLPAAIQSRNHYVGDGNQQATANTTTLWGGLLARNWPLVSFVASSDHSVQNIIDWCFSDEGIHLRDKYQTYSIRPLLMLAETLYFRGIDIYEPNKERLRLFVSKGFEDQYFWQFVEETRLRK